MDWRIVEPLLKLLPRRFHAPPVGPTPHDLVMEIGRSRLLRYREESPDRLQAPVLLVPSLVNRHFILDLADGRSVAGFLRGAGCATYMMDWGWPGPEDAHTTFDEILFDRLHTAVLELQRRHGRPVTLVGYCMGGTMALVYAARHPKLVANLVLLATPVDFDHVGLLTKWARFEGFNIDRMVDSWGLVPPKVFQPGFTLLRPAVITRKWVPFIQFARQPEMLQAYLPFFRWATENVPLPGQVLKTWVKTFFIENALMKDGVLADGERVTMGDIEASILNVIALDDHIVDTASPRALGSLLPEGHDYTPLELPMGHTDLSIGPDAMGRVWPQILDWLRARDGETT